MYGVTINRRASSVASEETVAGLRSSLKGRRPRKMDLSAFPDPIMGKICHNLSTSDLLSLVKASPKLHRPVQREMLRSLRLEIKRSKPLLPASADNWEFARDTALTSGRRLLLLAYVLITAPSHGAGSEMNGLVHELNANHCEAWGMKLDKFLDEQEMEFICRSMGRVCYQYRLLDVFKLMCERLSNVTRFEAGSLTLDETCELVRGFKQLQHLEVTARASEPLFNFPAEAPQLTSLQVNFEAYSDSALEELGEQLYERGIFEQLEELSIKFSGDAARRSPLTWVSLFQRLPQNECCMPKLTSLELWDCQFDDNQREIVDELSQLVPLAKLQRLSLRVFEYSHKMRRHSQADETVATAMELLLPRLKNLTSLKLHTTPNCCFCEHHSIIHTIESFAGIAELNISCNSMNKEHYLETAKALSKCKLARLTFYDDFLEGKLVNNLKNWFVYQNLMKFSVYDDFACEVSAQAKKELFEGYAAQSFCSFNAEQAGLLVLFWRACLPDFRLDTLLKGATDFKLFGYNFRVNRARRLVTLYINNDIGYTPLMFY